MRNPLFLKIVIIGLVLMMISIPLTLIGQIVRERQARQSEAVREIGASYAGPQKVFGPVLVMPYTERFMTTETVSDGEGEKRREQVERRIERARYVMPSEMAVQGNLETSVKHRGIFHVPVYLWQGQIRGMLVIPESMPIERSRNDSQITWGNPYLAVGLSDMRGVVGTPGLDVNGHQAVFEKGSGIAFSESGMHAPVALPEKGGRLAFAMKIALRGTERLSVVPLADSNRIELASAWPHPSFGGRFLPDAQTQVVGPEGFRANWNISALASGAAPQFLRAAASGADRCPDAACMDAVDLRLIEPVNIYTQSDRALKYGFLFVGITFAAFFLFELLKRLRIHPAQYFLVGLAQALFFLLVLSLSEHLVFAVAYLGAAGATVLLIAYYLAFVMQSLLRGALFGLVLGSLYAALYGLLISEDIALMLGSLLLFALLATAMVVTRRLDWYGLGGTTSEPAPVR